MSSIYELLDMNKSLRATDLLLKLLTHSKFIIGKKGSEGDYDSQFILNIEQLKNITMWMRERFVEPSEPDDTTYVRQKYEYKTALRQIIYDGKGHDLSDKLDFLRLNDNQSMEEILYSVDSMTDGIEKHTQQCVMR